MKVAILAGGLATRLLPLTGSVPKSLIGVGGRPFIEHQIGLLAAQGLRDIVLCTGHLGTMIEEHLGSGSSLGVRIEYSRDGGSPLGTGGALRKALPLLGDVFFVLYGDSYLTADYASVRRDYERSAKPGLMTVFHNEGRWGDSNVRFLNGKILEYDKRRPNPGMSHIDYGLQILSKGLFENAPPDLSFDLSDLLHDCVAAGNMAGYEVIERFHEVGSPEGLRDLQNLLTPTA